MASSNLFSGAGITVQFPFGGTTANPDRARTGDSSKNLNKAIIFSSIVDGKSEDESEDFKVAAYAHPEIIFGL